MLRSIGVHQYGAIMSYTTHSWGRTSHYHGPNRMEFYQCTGCKTEFPVINGEIRCNGQAITECPFCGPTESQAHS